MNKDIGIEVMDPLTAEILGKFVLFLKNLCITVSFESTSLTCTQCYYTLILASAQ